MRQLIGFELRKLLQKKIVYAGLAVAALFSIMMFFGWGVPATSVVTPEGERLKGTDAVQYMQKFDEGYKGELTDEKVKELSEVYPKDMEDNYYRIDLVSYVSSRFEDGSLTVKEAFTPEMGRINAGYSDGYSSLIFYVSNLMLLAGFVVIIAVSPVFSEEYARGTDALILTSRYGRSKCAGAKIIASFLFSSLFALVMIAVNLGLYLITQGTVGWDTSVQVERIGFLWNIPYEMNMGQLVGYSIVLWLAANILLTGIVLLISALSRNSFSALVIAAVFYAVPIIVNTGIPEFIVVMMPANQMVSSQICSVGPISVFGVRFMAFWIILVLSMLLTAVCSVLTKKGFARHQVV